MRFPNRGNQREVLSYSIHSFLYFYFLGVVGICSNIIRLWSTLFSLHTSTDSLSPLWPITLPLQHPSSDYAQRLRDNSGSFLGRLVALASTFLNASEIKLLRSALVSIKIRIWHVRLLRIRVFHGLRNLTNGAKVFCFLSSLPLLHPTTTAVFVSVISLLYSNTVSPVWACHII
jgi:hypothetical protein